MPWHRHEPPPSWMVLCVFLMDAWICWLDGERSSRVLGLGRERGRMQAIVSSCRRSAGTTRE